MGGRLMACVDFAKEPYQKRPFFKRDLAIWWYINPCHTHTGEANGSKLFVKLRVGETDTGFLSLSNTHTSLTGKLKNLLALSAMNRRSATGSFFRIHTHVHTYTSLTEELTCVLAHETQGLSRDLCFVHTHTHTYTSLTEKLTCVLGHELQVCHGISLSYTHTHIYIHTHTHTYTSPTEKLTCVLAHETQGLSWDLSFIVLLREIGPAAQVRLDSEISELLPEPDARPEYMHVLIIYSCF